MGRRGMENLLNVVVNQFYHLAFEHILLTF